LLPTSDEPRVSVVSARPDTGGRVLVVEDDADIREVVVETLVGDGYEAHGVPNGAEALDWLRTHSCGCPTLVILDMLMPVMAGPEFLSQLRSERGLDGVAVLLFTASTLDSQRLLHTPGVRGLLRKPASAADIISAVEAWQGACGRDDGAGVGLEPQNSGS